MDHDFMLANDFAGEVFLSLNAITGVNGEQIAGFSALAPTCMALTQPLKAAGNSRIISNFHIQMRFKRHSACKTKDFLEILLKI